jgi:hypothetical protein
LGGRKDVPVWEGGKTYQFGREERRTSMGGRKDVPVWEGGKTYQFGREVVLVYVV